MISEGALQTIPGVGAAIARRIEALHSGGSDESLETMRAKLPAGLLDLLAIPGLRPATILKLHKLLGVNALDTLIAACSEGRVAAAKGLGRALERKSLNGLAIASEGKGRVRMNRAAEILEQTILELERLRPELRKITVAGDFRRGCELVADLSLVAVSPQAAEVTEERLGAVRLHVSPPGRFGAALLSATGNARHVAQLKALARKKGLTLSANGLRRGEKALAARREDDIYSALGLPVIPPELREGAGEIGRALSGTLPDLVSMKNLRGVLHLHTDFSDGVNTLAEMAEAARRRGAAIPTSAWPIIPSRPITRVAFMMCCQWGQCWTTRSPRGSAAHQAGAELRCSRGPPIVSRIPSGTAPRRLLRRDDLDHAEGLAGILEDFRVEELGMLPEVPHRRRRDAPIFYLPSRPPLALGHPPRNRLQGPRWLVVAPPSRIAGGGSYRWVTPAGSAPPPLPPELREFFTQAQALPLVPGGGSSGLSLEQLRVSNRIKQLIRKGAPKGKRSEPLFAVLLAMVGAGHADEEIGSVLLDARNGLSDKPREKGPNWLRGELKRA